jgi:hypothetical protein
MVASLFSEAGAVQGKLVEDQFEDFIDLLADELGLEEQGGDYDSGMTEDDDVEEVEEEEKVVEDLVLMDDFATADASSLPSAKKATKRSREQIEEDEMPDDMAAEDMNTDYDEELDFGLGSPKLGTGPFAPATAEGLVKGEKGYHDRAALCVGLCVVCQAVSVAADILIDDNTMTPLRGKDEQFDVLQSSG